MIFRTDLALEANENLAEKINGIDEKTENINGLKLTEINIKTDTAAKKIGKPIGVYITIEVPRFTDNSKKSENKIKVISSRIRSFLPNEGLVFVVGLGNSSITPDALGPKTVESILATRHITGELARASGLDELRSVAVLSPGVLGQTGIEVSEIILSITKNIKPAAVLIIDALASQKTSRLGTTIQISNTGISPGSGVGNSRPEISEKVLGIPVISVGVPTVVDSITLANDLICGFKKNLNKIIKDKVIPKDEPMMVTPREIDLLIDRASKLIAMSVNCALHSAFSFDELIDLI